MTETRATPDTFVVLVPAPFETLPLDLVRDTHIAVWSEEVELASGEGVTSLSTDEASALIFDDPPLDDLRRLVSAASMPFGTSELAALDAAVGTSRLTSSNAALAAKLTSTFIEMGCPAAVVPSTHRMHSPRFVKHQAFNLPAPQSLVAMFVHAFDDDAWMRTRGLTAFGLPELETPISSGFNAAFFTLMDVATSMVAQGSAFRPGRELLVGTRTFTIGLGPTGLPEDPDVEINGAFGVLTVA